MSETTMPQDAQPLRKVTELMLYDEEALHLTGALILVDAVMSGQPAIAASTMLALNITGAEGAIRAIRKRLMDATVRGGA